MRIIDSHVHVSADKIDELLVASQRAGVGRLIASHLGDWSAYPSAVEVRAANAEAAQVVANFPEQISFLVYLNPQLPDWRTELERGIAAGAVGVKLWIALKNSVGALGATIDVLKACAEHNIPVLMHVFNRTGANLAGEIDLLELLQLSEAVPDCRMIGAHSGACIHDGRGLFQQFPANVCFDLSGSDPAEGLLRKLLQELPAERILFGSDAMGRSFASQLLKVFSASLSAEEQDLILWKNAARIYRLPAPPDLAAEALPEWVDRREDFHCYCGRDPFGVIDAYTPAELEAQAVAHGLQRIYCSSLDSLLLWDPSENNATLQQACANLHYVKGVPTVNPVAHNYQQVFAAAAKFANDIWISPYWSAVPADSTAIIHLGRMAAEQDIRLFINCGCEDYRFRHNALAPRPVQQPELLRLLDALPSSKLVIQGFTGELPNSANHKRTIFLPPDREGKSPAPGTMDLLYGSGFPYRPRPPLLTVASDRPQNGEMMRDAG
ncbi:MAG: amidohydrolase family protein, partial [Lentisphaeria bacterium]